MFILTEFLQKIKTTAEATQVCEILPPMLASVGYQYIKYR